MRPRRPLIVHFGPLATLDPVLDVLRREGHRPFPGFRPPRNGWAVADPALVCYGALTASADVAPVVLAAARGAGVAVAADERQPFAAELYGDLVRFGVVELSRPPAPRRAPAGNSDGPAVLALLATGATLDDAARALRISRRTASRRLAAIRAELGVATNAEAIRRLGPGPDTVARNTDYRALDRWQ